MRASQGYHVTCECRGVITWRGKCEGVAGLPRDVENVTITSLTVTLLNCPLVFFYLSRSYPLKSFKGCLPQNLLIPLLNTLSHMFLWIFLQTTFIFLKWLIILLLKSFRNLVKKTEKLKCFEQQWNIKIRCFFRWNYTFSE